jgi:hypothetical protein
LCCILMYVQPFTGQARWLDQAEDWIRLGRVRSQD